MTGGGIGTAAMTGGGIGTAAMTGGGIGTAAMTAAASLRADRADDLTRSYSGSTGAQYARLLGRSCFAIGISSRSSG